MHVKRHKGKMRAPCCVCVCLASTYHLHNVHSFLILWYAISHLWVCVSHSQRPNKYFRVITLDDGVVAVDDWRRDKKRINLSLIINGNVTLKIPQELFSHIIIIIIIIRQVLDVYIKLARVSLSLEPDS